MPGQINQFAFYEDYFYTSRIFEEFVLHEAEVVGALSQDEVRELMFLSRGWKIQKDAGAGVTIDTTRRDGHLRMTVDQVNEEAYFYTREHFLFNDTNSFRAICRFDNVRGESQFTNIIFGFISSVGADTILDDAGGPATGRDQALIWVNADESVYRCGAAPASQANPNHLSNVALIGEQPTAEYVTLMIEGETQANQIRVTYQYDNNGVGGFQPITDTFNKPIVDWFGEDSPELVSLVIGIKGGDTSSNSLVIDYIGGDSRRFVPASPP